MIIRRAKSSDLARVQEMAAAFGDTADLSRDFRVSPVKVERLVDLAFTHVGSCLYVAEDDAQRVVGMCGAHVTDHLLLEMKMAHVVAWWVEPDSRGTVGVSLLRQVAYWAFRSGGADVLQVSVPRRVSNADAVCAAIGFEQTESSWTLRSLVRR